MLAEPSHGPGAILPDDYFAPSNSERASVWAPPESGELFNRYTCSTCGGRYKTWASFKEHLKTVCRGLGGGNSGAQAGWMSDAK